MNLVLDLDNFLRFGFFFLLFLPAATVLSGKQTLIYELVCLDLFRA